MEPFLSHSVGPIFSDVIMILRCSYLRCKDSRIIISVEYRSDLLYVPIESILESSGQTRCTSCYTGAYFPPLVVEMNVSSQICYGLHCFGREMFICVTGHGFDDFYRDEP